MYRAANVLVVSGALRKKKRRRKKTYNLYTLGVLFTKHIYNVTNTVQHRAIVRTRGRSKEGEAEEQRVAERKSSLKYRQLYSFIYLYNKKKLVFFFSFHFSCDAIVKMLIWTHFMVHITFFFPSNCRAYYVQYRFSFSVFSFSPVQRFFIKKKKISLPTTMTATISTMMVQRTNKT